MAPTGIYVHRNSSFGILLSNDSIREVMSQISDIPLASENRSFETMTKRYKHYRIGFLEAGVKAYERALANKNKKIAASSVVVATTEEAKEAAEPSGKEKYLYKDMIPVREIDLFLLYLLVNEDNTRSRLEAGGADLLGFELALEDTEGTLFDFIPEKDMPEHVRAKKLTVFRLLKMLNGSIFLTWRPENEGFLMIDDTSDFWKASLSNVEFYGYPIPSPFAAVRWRAEDGSLVVAQVCLTIDIVRLFMTVRKKCDESWSSVGDDAF